MRPLFSVLFIAVLCCNLTAHSQNDFHLSKDFLKEHLSKKKYSLDSDAKAIVLYEKVAFSVAEDRYRYYSVRQVTKVVKILTKEGTEYADVMVPYGNGRISEFRDFEATTYNLENGEIVKHKIGKDDLKYEAALKSVTTVKFSMPAVKEGSVISYTYVVQEGMDMTVANWEFQEEIPKLYSEMISMFPGSLEVVVRTQGRYPFLDLSKVNRDEYDTDTLKAYTEFTKSLGRDYTSKRWVRRDVPAIREEPYNDNVGNYSDLVEVQVTGSAIDERIMIGSISTWERMNDELYKNKDNFGQAFDKNSFLEGTLSALTGQNSDSLEIAKEVFRFVRDSIVNIRGSATNIEKAFNNKKGTVLAKNILLTAMLRKAGYDCKSVILGKRGTLRVSERFPAVSKLNYVITLVKIKGAEYLLDASNEYYPFGVIPAYCYNGFAWAIDKEGSGFYLTPDLIRDKSAVIIKTVKDDAEDYRIAVEQYYGDFSAPVTRKRWIEDTTLIQKDLLKRLKESTTDYELVDFNVENLHEPDKHLILKYTVKFSWPESGMVYFNPRLIRQYQENPFKSVERYYPVEMPYASDVNYSMRLKLPEGYKVDELPESLIAKIDDKNDYKYLIDYKPADRTLILNSRLYLSRTVFNPEEYHGLKDFFDKVVEQEQKICVIEKEI